MIEYIKSFFTDNSGNNSSLRILIFLVVIVFLFNWTWINIKTGQLTPISWEQAGLLVGSFWAKAKQKEYEG